MLIKSIPKTLGIPLKTSKEIFLVGFKTLIDGRSKLTISPVSSFNLKVICVNDNLSNL